MIEVLEVDGLTGPRVFCDSCGSEISSASRGAVVFDNFMKPGRRSKVAYVHKSSVKEGCMTKGENDVRANGGTPGWMELGEYLWHVCANLGVGNIDSKAS